MLSLIVAFDKNRVIGKDNDMPWHYPEDLKYFKRTTLGHKVVMGSNTFRSILDCLGNPFPNRESIVITHEAITNTYDNVKFYDNLQIIEDLYADSDEEVFIAGGMSIYEQMYDKCDRLYITHIDNAYDGDAYFPNIDLTKYNKISEEACGELSFCVYEKR